ncbi:MAG: FAD-dependent oxidoreductase [Planctomycetota bacterium]|nr:FAD-dependent oxidoreductase [Planctomycetota bacterium]
MGAGEKCDVAVIGAGIQGAGVAQALAAAGYQVRVLEKSHPAAGTSSKSSKLIHGGLRYLETFEFGLVRESLKERATLLRIAPHLVRMVPFHIPVYRGMRRGPLTVRAGLCLYALLGGLGKEARFSTVPKDGWDLLDGLKQEGLRSVFRYYDGQTDDAALCRAVITSAHELGAHVMLGAELIAAEADSHGWTLRYHQEEAVHELHARVVVNAAGPWVAQVLDHFTPKPPHREVDLVGGTHIELEGTLDQGIYYTEAPADGRAVFSMPWKGRILVGTTENPWRDPDEVQPTQSEIEYLVETFSNHFPGKSTTVVDSWAGLRVLPRAEGAAFARSREVVLIQNHTKRPSVLSIYGGKLTGYRATAERVLQRIAPSLGPAERKADTATLRLPDLSQ